MGAFPRHGRAQCWRPLPSPSRVGPGRGLGVEVRPLVRGRGAGTFPPPLCGGESCPAGLPGALSLLQPGPQQAHPTSRYGAVLVTAAGTRLVVLEACRPLRPRGADAHPGLHFASVGALQPALPHCGCAELEDKRKGQDRRPVPRGEAAARHRGLRTGPACPTLPGPRPPAERGSSLTPCPAQTALHLRPRWHGMASL